MFVTSDTSAVMTWVKLSTVAVDSIVLVDPPPVTVTVQEWLSILIVPPL